MHFIFVSTNKLIIKKNNMIVFFDRWLAVLNICGHLCTNTVTSLSVINVLKYKQWFENSDHSTKFTQWPPSEHCSKGYWKTHIDLTQRMGPVLIVITNCCQGGTLLQS